MIMSPSLRVGLVSRSEAIVSLVRESVTAAFPTATVADVVPDAAGKLPDCALIFIDATDDAAAAGVIAQQLRAGASRSALAFVVSARDESLAKSAAAVGALEQIETGALGPAMAETVERAIGGNGWTDDLLAARDELRRTQRLLAAGEIALGLQHAMNNPLTAVLAEAQLLEMETLPPDVMTAVGRIIESTRRLVALVRKLDVVSAKRTG
jgi:signal transduction histidine kinase